MRTTIPFLAIFALFCAASPITPSQPDPSFAGAYRLRMEGLTRFGTDTITLSDISLKGVAGEVGIDLGIGPEARTPLAWERFYTLPFKGRLIAGGAGFTCSVAVAGRNAYEYTLFFMHDKDDKHCLVGSVRMRPLAKGERAPAVTRGVLATATGERE